MEPLSAVASIIAVLQLSAKVLTYLNDVKDAPRDRTQCAVEILNLCSLLYKLRDHVEKGDPMQPWYTAVQGLAVKNGPLDQFKQALETLQTKMTDGGRLKKAGEALVWKFKKEEVARILDRIERLKSLVEIALQMDHLKLSQAIKDDTSFVRTQIPIIRSGVDEIRQDQDSVRHRKLLEWISPTDYPAQQSDIIKRRQEGTGQWFLDAPEMTRWLSEARGTLFCPGIPGAGKTMVAAIAIDHLLKSVQDNSHGVAYVYYNYKAQEEQDASTMLAAILKQLVQAQPSMLDPVERLHNRHANRGTRPSLEEVFGTLRDVLARYPTVHIVIDALDECQKSSRSQFLDKLRDLRTGRDIRLMATSRIIPEIVDEFSDALRVEVQASKDDVKRFVAGQTDRLPKCIQRDPELQGMVQEKIVEAVGGMFLLARLHTDSLLDKRTPNDVKLTLSKLSRGSAALEDAYEDALQRIESQLDGDHQLAKRVLSWITFAKMPLTTAEICCALAVKPNTAEIDKGDIYDAEDLLSVCAGLVVVDQESAIIRLAHYTTQEYFERILDAWHPGAQLHIASACLTYLSFSVFRSGRCPTDEEFEERLRQNEFLDYAAKHWGEHARAVEAEVSNLACSFLLDSGLFSCAAQVLSVRSYRYKDYSKFFIAETCLHYTAQFGLSQITGHLLSRIEGESVSVVNAADSWGQTPLLLAVEYGHEETVELLLDKGADINSQSVTGGIALQAASAEGHEQLVKLLLNKGANVNAQCGRYGSALQAASAKGHEQLVRLLLDNGADVNAQGGWYGNALQAAAAGGKELVVKLLLQAGAEINTEGGRYGNALFAAVAEGHENTITLLLEKGANVAGFDARMKGIMHHAVDNANCKSSLVALFLDRGAPMDTVDSGNMTPLHYCVKFGHKAVAKLLLDRGVHINSGVHRKAWIPKTVWDGITDVEVASESTPQATRVSAGLTPLHFAALTSNLTMTEFLLEHGADPNAFSDYGESPLHLALRTTLYGTNYQDDWLSRWWRVEALYDFIDFDGDDDDTIEADISQHRIAVLDALLSDPRTSLTVKGCEDEYPLHCIRYKRPESTTVIQKLESRGADLFCVNSKRQTALHLASKAGDHESVILLLSLGLEVTLTDDEGLNALHHAAWSGNRETVIAILDTERAKTVNLVASTDRRGRNALHHLLSVDSFPQVETVQLLLSHGLEGSELDESGASPLVSYLQSFRFSIDVDICRLLLGIKGNASFVDNDGQTLGHLCARTSRFGVPVLKALKEHGVDMTKRDLRGRTMLHHAALCGSLTEDSLDFLLNVVGLQLSAEDSCGRTALQYATEEAAKVRSQDIFDGNRWKWTKNILLRAMFCVDRMTGS